MPSPSKELKAAESVMQDVIENLIDSQQGFLQIGERLHDPTLRRFFMAESLKRAEFRGELETILHQEGVHDIEESGTVAGTVHRVWADLKSRLGGGDQTLLETAEEGENVAQEAYEKAISAPSLPLPIRQLLSTQAAHIQLSHDYVRGRARP
jgi:uncharacterized protein (TIGR02284 family)